MIDKTYNLMNLLSISALYNALVVSTITSIRTALMEVIGGSAVVVTGGTTAAVVAAPVVAVVGTAIGFSFLLAGLAEAAVNLILT